MSDQADEDRIYQDISDLAVDLHLMVKALAIYPPEIAAIVVTKALRGGPIRGKRRRRLQGFVFHEVRALREAKAMGDHVTFEEPAEPDQEAA